MSRPPTKTQGERIAVVEQRMDSHEAECARRYEGISLGLDEIKSGMVALGSSIYARLWVMAGAVFALLLGLLGWAFTEIYSFRTAEVSRVKEAHRYDQSQER